MNPKQAALFDDQHAAPEPPAPALESSAPEARRREARRIAFSFVGRGAADLLRSAFDDKQFRVARSVYDALTELASEARSNSEFSAQRVDVARRARVCVKTVDNYVKRFEDLGLVAVDRRRGGRRGGNLPNLYRLLEVDGDARFALAAQGESPCAPTVAQGEPGFAPTELKKTGNEENNVVRLEERPPRGKAQSPRDERRARRAAALDVLAQGGDR